MGFTNAGNLFISFLLPCYLKVSPDESGVQEHADMFNSIVPSSKAYDKNYKCLLGE